MAVTADWNPLGDVFYRKYELYSMLWADEVDLSKFTVAAAAYGGPIALMKKESAKSTPTKPIIYIFSSAGKLISSIKWNSGVLMHLGWQCNENLLCVQEDGTVLVHDLMGNYLRTFSMGQEAKDVKVIDCQVFNSYHGTGIAIVTSSYRIFLVSNVEDPRIRRLAEVPDITEAPSCWTVINHDRQSRALVACRNELYLLDQSGQCEKQSPPVTGEVDIYIAMAASFNNKYLALFSDKGMLWIGSADLQKVYCEFDTKCPAKPEQLVWCGTGAIVGYWENILLMVGPQKDWVKYSYDTAVCLVPEIDGLRIVGQATHELLQRVPGVVEDIFKIGSMAPGAMLYEASREFQKSSQRADEYIRMIKDRLDTAVEQCVDAAGQEYEPTTQKTLLRAASFGKCFLTEYQPEAFVDMCQMLRVLNALREFNIGIPLTYAQLQHLTLPVLIDRLVLRQLYCLALRICNYLKMPDTEGASRVLAHWACFKVQKSSHDDEMVARAIAQKLGDTPGVSYSEIANKAIERGRTELAIRLLDFEPKAAEQVPLLMRMHREQLALSKAIESGDSDLVYMVLLHLRETLPQGELFMAVRSHPTAYALLLQHYKQQNRSVLKDLYYQEDNFVDGALCKISDSYDEERVDARITNLMAARDSFSKAKNEWAAKQSEEQAQLLRYQRKLEEELNRPFLDQPLHLTIHNLTLQGNHRMAEELRKVFKVPDRRYWWLKIQALSESGEWAELEKFSKSKKSPVGYEPFVEVCMKQDNSIEAAKYLPRVTLEHKVKCYIRVGQLEQAADIALQQRNVEDLTLIQTKCGASNRALAEKITIMKVGLTSGK